MIVYMCEGLICLYRPGRYRTGGLISALHGSTGVVGIWRSRSGSGD